MRILAITGLLLLVGSPLAAQPQIPSKDGKVVIPITISPAAPKKLQSRYLLTPQYQEMKPGNRIQGFMRTFMEQDAFFAREPSEQREKWNDLPLGELPLKTFRENHGVMTGNNYPSASDDLFFSPRRPLSDVDDAARYRNVDWQEWFHIRREGFGMLLPELQKMRDLARVLKLRMRVEVASGEFDRAIYSARTFHGLANACEQHPTLIASLVGIAIQSMNLGVIQEMIQQPGAPNLYWGLTELSHDVISIRLALQGERLMLSHQFESLLNAKGPLPDAEISKAIKTIMLLFAMIQGDKQPPLTQLRYALLASDPKTLEAARALLVELGMKAEVVKTLGAMQVIVTADIRRYEIHRDEYFKYASLPHWQALPGMAKALAALTAEKNQVVIAPQLLSSIRSVKQAETRTHQTVAYLTVIEAIRWHAHEHGKLPAKLADITNPLPLDPVTGKDFEYTLVDGVATLHGGNPNEKNEATNRYFEIRLRK